MNGILLGSQTCGDLASGAAREWLVTDGLGGYAMGTVSGLRTRRYHGLLVTAVAGPGGRRMALASLDPVLVLGDRRVRLGVHAWESGATDPQGHRLLARFALVDGLPSWRWMVDGVVLERTLALARGRPAVGVVHRLVAAPGAVRLELSALGTWRDVHGERFGTGPAPLRPVDGGAIFDDAWRVDGPGFVPAGDWYRGVRHPEEAARGLADHEDLCHLGTFARDLAPGDTLEVLAWAGELDARPDPAATLVDAARARARAVVARAKAADPVDAALALAADHHRIDGPTAVAGYPWFGEWSRDSLTSYAGLYLETGEHDAGRALLARLAGRFEQGLLPNTTDGGDAQYNTADATPWYLHVLARHVEATGDTNLAAEVLPAVERAVADLVAGTRYGIRVDAADGLLTQGADGVALTWMDARVRGRAVTPRAGKPVEVNALWVAGLTAVARLQRRLGRKDTLSALADRARSGFPERFVRGGAVLDVASGPGGDDASLRPNQLFAVGLPGAPLQGDIARSVVDTVRRRLLTPLGPRSLDPADPAYRGSHHGGPARRDRAYHQGTVWPWLTGIYVDAALATGAPTDGVLDGLEAHLGEWGLGSVSETTDGDAPHLATGCPFQAWSVAEVLRARRRLIQSR